MRFIQLIVFTLALFSIAGTGPIEDLDSNSLSGTWVRVSEIPAGGGYFRKGVTLYRIGLDQTTIPDTINKWRKPLSLAVGYNILGQYIYDYWYVTDPKYVGFSREVSYQSTRLVGGERSTVKIKLVIDENQKVMADTISVTIGTETFGLRRGR
jgi:hypothetical protein